MARINHKIDQELATKGLLRISIVAKALKIAPKTVNAWTTYPITKVGGVKYLTWLDVYNDKKSESAVFNLNADAAVVHTQITNTKVPINIKVLTALEKARALLPKKTLPKPQELIKEFQVSELVKESVIEEFPEPTEILVPVKVDEDVLTLPDEFKHLARKS